MHQFKVSSLNSVHLICDIFLFLKVKIVAIQTTYIPWTDAFLSLLAILVYTVFSWSQLRFLFF